jgi:hypothetical protein
MKASNRARRIRQLRLRAKLALGDMPIADDTPRRATKAAMPRLQLSAADQAFVAAQRARAVEVMRAMDGAPHGRHIGARSSGAFALLLG